MNGLLSLFSRKFGSTVVYMLQQSEYRAGEYLKWLWRTRDFNRVVARNKLKLTLIAKILLVTMWFLLALFAVTGVILIIDGLTQIDHEYLTLIGGVTLLLTPLLASNFIIIPISVGNLIIIKPVRSYQTNSAHKILNSHKATKIAVAGSYGKTTMKQLLATVLAEGKPTAFTAGNLNTSVAHYRFAKNLTGKEKFLVVEYGEYRPGDIAQFNKVFEPQIGILTGLNEAHLVNFGSIQRSAENLMSLASYVGTDKLWFNAESASLVMFGPQEPIFYSQMGVDGWKTSNIKVSIEGTKFTLKKGNKTLNISSALIGRHNVGPMAAVAALASSLGLNKKQIEDGFFKTTPVEHRMQPYIKEGNVTLIDDTYNGNVDGVRVGLELLNELKAKRKVYVTPGLVEQGHKTVEIHKQIGKLIAPVADVVVLMQNSVTDHIKAGLEELNFEGKLIFVDDPLGFYTKLDRFTASGDLVLMQNDWPDSYR